MSLVSLSGSTTNQEEHTRRDLSVQIDGLRLRSPILPASGCFGPSLAGIADVDKLGATVTKTVFAEVRAGNPTHRVSEIRGGMVNSVGIPSLGPDGYLNDLSPAYRELGPPVVVSVGGHRVEEYPSVVSHLEDAADAFELNVSCPNLDRGGREIGTDPEAIGMVVERCSEYTDRPLIVKLSPMVAAISEGAEAAEDAGAAAVCVSNSIPALPIDRQTRRPALGHVVGGLSGPPIRAIVTRLVWQTAHSVGIPVIACGGISDTDDVLDYFAVGATLFQVGTATFNRPNTMAEIAKDLEHRLIAIGGSTLSDLIEPW